MANILIVDSYLSIGLLYREVLREKGHRVFVMLSGQEAVHLARHENIDIAVVDDKLRDFEAERVLERLKQLQPHIRGILSVSRDFDLSVNARLWNGIFVKSNDFNVLESEIKRICQ
jgi:DNA-binding response OmpR family regulator